MHQPETWGYIQFSNTPIGIKPTTFKFNKDELCKWELRKIYYAQKKYHHEHREYSNNIEFLNLNFMSCSSPEINISVKANSFQAIYSCETCRLEWTIFQDGEIVSN